MSEFLGVLPLSELPPGAAREVLVQGKPVALFNVGGVVHAIGNTCIHRGGPLGQGSLDGHVVMCPWHAWTYDVTTGANTENPELSVPKYEARVEDGTILVNVG